ncbi:MAG: hypothetical protein NTW19_05250 [Planctomycetota bacterium]|nr:hypothetical protein [Planctomycetota bacterium]
MTQAYDQLLDQVHLVRQSWRARRMVEGALLALASLAVALVLTAALDQLLAPGVAGRLFLALALWAITGLVAWRWLVRPATAQHPIDFYAALAEQRNPALRNRLINAIQLGREANPVAPRLIDAIVSDGATAAQDIDLTRSVESPMLRRAAGGLTGALALVALYLLLAGPGARIAMARVLLPAADILPFTWARVTLVTPDKAVTIREGLPLTVNALVDVRDEKSAIPDAFITWTDSAGHRRSAGMRPATKDPKSFTYVFASVESAFVFHVAAGDGSTADIPVSVERRPRVAKMAVTYHYPAYAVLPDRKVDDFDGHLHGLPQTKASLTVQANKPLQKLAMVPDSGSPASFSQGPDALTWTVDLTLTANGVYSFKLLDAGGYDMDDPTRYTITLEADAAPVVGFSRPGRDTQVQPDTVTEFALVAQDDLGIGPVRLVGRLNNDKTPGVIHEWPTPAGKPVRRIEMSVKKSTADLKLKAGDRLEYWATVEDLNNVSPTGPGRGESRRFNLMVLTPEQVAAQMEKDLNEYAKTLTEMIRLQRLNRNETAATPPAQPLIDREGLIRRQGQKLAELMQKNAFPAQTMIDELQDLASGPMAKVISLLESFRDAHDSEAGKASAASTLPVQDKIVLALEEMLKRLDRDQAARAELKKIEKTDQAAHREVTSVLARLSKDLDKFLAEQRDLEEKYEKVRKADKDDVKGEDLNALNNALHQLDRWKQWAKDSADGIAKLPEGFVKDSALAENVNTIFEEIDKQQKGATTKIDTPLEEGVKADGTKVLEDLEIWMPQKGDAVKITMEEPTEGKFEVPPYNLPAALQDMVGDLVEDIKDFDEEADDVTSSWGGNMGQAGWDIVDGPISGFNALGKTGNQLPNEQEVGGRSGVGRRGRSSGQMVGDTSKGMEGRPTPARLTKEPYEAGNPKSEDQLDPRGATGGGKKTGGGARGLQGGTPPDFVKDMERLKEEQKQLREKTQQLAKQLENAGKPSTHVNRALQLLDSSMQDMKDLRYEEAARRRKVAINELKSEANQIDQAVSLSLDKAPNLPPELRQQISSGAQQALPEGYEELVGAYYKAISNAASGQPAPAGGADPEKPR